MHIQSSMRNFHTECTLTRCTQQVRHTDTYKSRGLPSVAPTASRRTVWCVGSVDNWYNRVVHATGAEITGTEKLYVVPNGKMCNHGSDCALVGFVRGYIVRM